MLSFFCIGNVEARTNEEILMPNQTHCQGIGLLSFTILSRRTYSDVWLDGILALAQRSAAHARAAKEWFHRIYIYNKARRARWHGHVMPVMHSVVLWWGAPCFPMFCIKGSNQYGIIRDSKWLDWLNGTFTPESPIFHGKNRKKHDKMMVSNGFRFTLAPEPIHWANDDWLHLVHFQRRNSAGRHPEMLWNAWTQA